MPCTYNSMLGIQQFANQRWSLPPGSFQSNSHTNQSSAIICTCAIQEKHCNHEMV